MNRIIISILIIFLILSFLTFRKDNFTLQTNRKPYYKKPTQKKVVIIDRLPKTRSGKIVRSTMVKIANHEKWMIPATIEDATVLDEISRALEK